MSYTCIFANKVTYLLWFPRRENYEVITLKFMSDIPDKCETNRDVVQNI